MDIEVENALLKSALGFKVTVRKPFKLKEVKMKAGEGRIETERIEYAEEEVYIPPQATAQIYWLKNRRRDKWKDKWDIDVNATEEVLATAREILGGVRSVIE